jgi:ribose transport system ATP-binding protein
MAAQAALAPATGTAVVSLDGVSKSYGGVHAVKSLTFSVAPGEVVALAGENGAGKSTTKNLICGQVRADEGEVLVSGEHNPRDTTHARRLGVLAVHQEFSLFPTLSVADNVFLYGRRMGGQTLRNRAAVNAACSELLKEVGAKFSPRALVSELSPAEQQLVEVVKALAQDPKMLILDEPTASLNLAERERIHQIVRRLVSRGVGILYITHHLEEIFELSDRTVVMRDGALVHDGPTSELNRDKLEQLMVGRAVQFSERAPEPSADAPVKLRLKSLAASGIQEPVSLEIRAGEIFGLAGLIGSGRTELAHAVFGLSQATGTVEIDGRPLHRRNPRKSKRNSVAFVTEDRRHEGLFLERSIEDNLSIVNLPLLAKFGFISSAKRRQEAAELVRELRVKGGILRNPARSLSGGNQQKLVLGKWLVTNPEVIILDEPTRGIDVGAKAEVHDLISRLAARGKAILLISSDMPEVLGLSHRVGVMHNGRLASILPAAKANPESVIRLATGGEL